LHYAVSQNNQQLVNLLLENYADVMAQCGKQQNALHIACTKGYLEIYKMIVSRHYNCKNSVDKNGKTPLDLADQNKHTIILDYDKKLVVTLYNSDKAGHNSNQKLSAKDFKMVMPLG
jgi:serine/threonine protein kinase